MTRGLETFLRYLGAYLAEDTARIGSLKKFFKKTTGDVLHDGNLYRYLKRRNEPRGDALIAFMLYLHDRGELVSGGKGGPLFTYARPEILK